MEITFEPNLKQDLVFDLFDDDKTTEIIYGGSAGGGKSYLICALLILKALQNPGIRIGLARNELTTLKKTTIISFFEVASDWDVTSLFSYNSTAGVIKFTNGSEIVLIELSYKPSDPKYTRLGGHLLTFGVVDEVGEVDERGYSVFKSRLGRWKNELFNIKPICISTCNPVKNWLYKDFYRPFIEGNLNYYIKFIQALPTDNHYLPQSYIENLKKLPFAERERLLNGNWDYDDDPNSLMSHDEILNIWDNVPKVKCTKYITADIAFTSDKMVVILWNGLIIEAIYVNPPGKIEDFILKLANDNGVANYNIAYDSDGVGQFLKQRLRNSKPIINNAKALKDENYKNLKTQLYYKLSEKVKDNSVKCLTENYKKEITEELTVVKYKPTNTVGKLCMIDKSEVKKVLRRSPDFSDAMAYRMFFEYKPSTSRTFRI